MKLFNNMKLLPKTFIVTITLMISIILISFVLLYLLMPQFYKTYKQNEITKFTNELVNILEKESTDKTPACLTSFMSQKPYGLAVTDGTGKVIFSINIGSMVKYTSSVPATPGYENYENTIIVTDYLNEKRTFTNTSGEYLTVTASVSLQPLGEASTVILKVIPYSLIICTIISSIIGYFYSKAITRPIKSISDTTINMRKLDTKALCEVTSKDEIGVLANNVNDMYGKLLSTIENLKLQIESVTEAEHIKMDFMRMVSHELKTPLTAVNGMIEGMLYNVGIYKDRDTFLMECHKMLSNLASLIKEMLGASSLDMAAIRENTANVDIGYLVEHVSEPYKIIALSRNINFYIDKSNSFTSSIPADLIAKALSNIISNAVNYTGEGESAKIYFESNRLIVQNECIPLSEEDRKHIFEPFYRPDFSRSKNTGGNGLGLYLTDRILKSCSLSYEFIPFINGMRFTIFF